MISERLSFGELLKTYRFDADMTQMDLADKAGVGVETISALERGINTRPRKSTVDRLCDALQLGPDQRAEFEYYAKPQPRPWSKIIRINPVQHGDPAQRPHSHAHLNEGETTIPMSHLVALSIPAHTNTDEAAYSAHRYTPSPDLAPTVHETDRVYPQHGDTAGSLFSRLLLQKRTAIITTAIAIALTMTTTLLLLKFLSPQTPTSRLPTIINIVDGKSGLQLHPVLASVSGSPCVIAGQPVTATFTFQNTDATNTRLSTITAVEASVRGPSPDNMRPDWSDPVINFPAVVRNFNLRPGETLKYEQSRTFTQPGTYFVEPTKSGDGLNWVGFTDAPRIYFRVVPPGAQILAAAGCVLP